MTNEQLYILLKTLSDGLDNILADLPGEADRIVIYNKKLKLEHSGKLILNISEDMYEEVEESFDPDHLFRLYEYAEYFRNRIEILTQNEK